MGQQQNGECLKCGAELLHFLNRREMKCIECGKTENGNIACRNGHFVCDVCHAKLGIQHMMMHIADSKSKNPLHILRKAMDSQYVHMHGNEHHVLVGASLMTAYRNAGGQIDLPSALAEMRARGGKYPGGACGFWGACGAAVSAGMYMSIVTEATPLTEESWGFANRTTAVALMRMADIGGPRCCKRNSFIAVEAAVRLTKELLHVKMEFPERIVCDYYRKNNQCIRTRCPYFLTERGKDGHESRM